MTRRAGGAGLLGRLLLLVLLAAGTAPLTRELPEPRSLAGKIRVHPRGNLWATGSADILKESRGIPQRRSNSAPANITDFPDAQNHQLLGTSDIRATSLGWLSLKEDYATPGAIGFEGLKHVDLLKNL